ncbi:hypothetical protein D3C76_10450 [compost metagenome]
MSQDDLFEFFQSFVTMYNLNNSEKNKDCVFMSYKRDVSICQILFSNTGSISVSESSSRLKFTFRPGFDIWKKEKFIEDLSNKGFELFKGMNVYNLYNLTIDQLVDVMSNHVMELFS